MNREMVWRGFFITGVFLAVWIGFSMSSCDWDEDDYDGSFFDPGRGTLEFYADGEEFIRDGFQSVDGWDMEFTHLFVNVQDIVARQTSGVQPAGSGAEGQLIDKQHAGHDTPGESTSGTIIEVPFPGAFFVDLHDPAGPTLLGTRTGIIAGNYDAVDFSVTPADALESAPVAPATPADLINYAGYTLALIGSAVHGVSGDAIIFEILLDEELPYTDCGPNDYAGFVSNLGVGEAHLTFHIDHVFGDADEAPGEGVNAIALGLQPIADAFCGAYPCDLTAAGAGPVTQADLADNLIGADYLTFIDALRTVGHSGEGHCHLLIY